MIRFFGAALLCAALLSVPSRPSRADNEGAPRKVLIVVEGATSLKNHAVGDGRQLATLLGHFHVTSTVLGVNEYSPRRLEASDLVFYIGYHAANVVPSTFLGDVLATKKPVIWLGTGFREFSERRAVRERWGFRVSDFDSTGQFTTVRYNALSFAKGEPNINIIEIGNRKKVSVVATAVSAKTRREVPYIVRADNLQYVADSPFASAGEQDRYLLFADMLHDILGEQHEPSHTALIRIEDVNPMENPDRLREIADLLSGKGIPFLVGVSPFYVSPGEGIRVSLSDKPEMVDALKYLVQNGGTIVMHGVTHQYRGITGADYEFWDESINGPIREETVDGIRRKLDMGLQEFMRCGIYPLVWETPHYTASFRLYQTVAQYFSTAMEQRLSIEDFDYSQFFPYVIERDLFGQRIYPENLGYVPLDADIEVGRAAVRRIIAGAKANLAVRDGFASCFFHAFVDRALLEEVVEGVRDLGYTYLDMRDQTNWVHLRDRAIASGNQRVTVTLADQYLSEVIFNREGEPARTMVSEKRLRGPVTRAVELEPGQVYRAEPVEFRESKPSFIEHVVQGAERFVHGMVAGEESWQEARPLLLWNPAARGGTFNDQSSFAAVFRSVNIALDTIVPGRRLDLSRTNLVIVPYGVVDSLREQDFDDLTRFVAEGGNLITDTQNDLIVNFGVTFGLNRLKVIRVRDRAFPEERIRWHRSELATKFDVDRVDEVFCVDDATDAPLVIGKPWRKGKVLFFATRFDPHSRLGYSQYPYLLEYVRQYFRLGPVARRDNLEVFFDPGFRRTLSTEQLVRQWVRQGIRIVTVAGWHQYPKYTYDYERLLRLAHANGILVYAWLEPPQVSQKFWLEHPEWREKNYKGEDVRPSWRYPMAMTDDRCLQAMTAEYRAFLERYDWDGVNLAEVYFDAAKGLTDQNLFTPMHPSAQGEVRKRYGIDLARIFTPDSPDYWKSNPAVRPAITEYRVQELTRVYEKLLAMIRESTAHREGFQVMVTAMDELGSPELREYIGVDIHRILELQRKFGFSLQIEDPENLWSTDPLRYVGIGRRYADLLGNRERLLLDLNILQFRKPEALTPFPTQIQTGTESFHLVRAAALGAPRLTVYSESSVNPQDMMFFPYALAAHLSYRVTDRGTQVDSPTSFFLKLPPQIAAVQIDDMTLTPVRDNLYLIPAGNHTVRTLPGGAGAFSARELETRILSFTGNILAVAYGMRSAEFAYDAPLRSLLSVNREPRSLRVDGRQVPLAFWKGNDCYSVYLPAGKHSVELVAGDPISYGINLTSFWSTTAIAVFGSLAVASLVLMYFSLKIFRRRAGMEKVA